ncbi:putative Gaf domaincontaining protein [Globisporangium polare]
MIHGLGFSRFMVQNFNQAAPNAKSAATTTELLPEAMSRRSTAEEDDTPSPQDEEEEQQQPRLTHLSYERIARIASQTATRIDWRQLRNSTTLWDEKKKLSASANFSIFTRQSRGVHYVMAVGTVSCSVSELRAILRPTTDAKYAAAMAELYGDAFLQGSIVHRSRSSSVASSTSTNNHAPFGRGSVTPHTGETFRSSQRYVNHSATPGFMAKSATFAKAHVFAKAQQWRYLECYQPSANQSGFTVTMSSLSPYFQVPGQSSKPGLFSSTEQLQGITTTYSVLADDPHQPSGELQVTFYSKFAEDCTSFSPLKRQASKLTLKTHLLAMARATTRLPIIVRRKRLEVLSPTDTKAFTLANPLCICCTATLHLFKAKTRCHSCGYFVCDKCSLEQEVEVENPQAPIVRTRVCQPCIRRVDEAVYERVSIEDGESGLRAAPVTRGPTSSMADLLDHIFHTGPDNKKQAVMSVIKYVLDDDEKTNQPTRTQRKETRTSSLSPPGSPRASRASSPDKNDWFTHTDPRSEKDYLRALQTHLTLKSRTSQHQQDASAHIYTNTTATGAGEYDDIGDFTDSGGSGSSYVGGSAQNQPFKSHHDYRHAVTPPQPIQIYASDDDAYRSKMARRHLQQQRQQLAAAEDVSSLEVICSIACAELSCAVAMVTVVEHDLTHVVATNSAAYRHTVVPREESLCAYTVMKDEPLLVMHPEQDPRFRNFAMVQRGLRFYCGFPLKTERGGAVVGTLCCGDFSSRGELSQAQVDAMTKLAATAAKVMQLRGKLVYKRL